MKIDQKGFEKGKTKSEIFSEIKFFKKTRTENLVTKNPVTTNANFSDKNLS